MKIALLYFGRLDRYRDIYENMKEYIFQDKEIDIFISHSPILNEDMQGFIELYKPIAYLDEPMEVEGRLNENYNTTCHFINKMRVFELLEKHCLENNVEYDIIVAYRPDNYAYEKLNYEQFDVSNENTIYIPRDADYDGGLNDQVAIGNKHSMKKYMNIYKNLNKLLDSGCRFHPETLFRWHVADVELDVRRFGFNYFVRGIHLL
jgi:hypothetical protein